jgi:multidrug resistance efflux pump
MPDAKVRYYTGAVMGDPADKALPEARAYINVLEAEVERLTAELNQSRDRLRACAAERIAERAQVERLRVLVSDAYVEGYKRGSAGVPRGLLDADYAWTQSKARAALAAAEEGGDDA